ncbi:NAM-associated domain-containing protein [Heracleum sosnowskyi]|uniref:NAM-associated domain-containing protein n=1 Tax=Heracleum sosnowskyi TaxID=360622 RepID=A0AAD8HGV2_9APIA|nr:NAM-associated domain-containing protein [Heracleum sosnowskyi]
MAKQTYYDDTGKYFTGMDGCWAILAESIKWQDIKPSKRTTKTIEISESEDKIASPIHDKDTQIPSNFESVDVAETTPCSGCVSSPRKRPSGTKLAKQNKIKNKVQELESARHINFLETLNKSMTKNQAKRIELEERRVASLERQPTCEEKKMERNNTEATERIMGMNLSATEDPERRVYYQYRRNAILAKWSRSSSTYYYPDLLEY